MCPPFAELEAVATATLQELLNELPDDLRAAAESVPTVMFQRGTHPFPCDEHDADDLLGLFSGTPLGDPQGDPLTHPPVIHLFLENHWEECEGNWQLYRLELRQTWLHEFGHYLGWDEEEVEQRGLSDPV